MVTSGTTNPGATQKPDNSHKGIRNPIPWKPDNPLKGIRDLLPKLNPYSLVQRVKHTNLNRHKLV